MIEFPDESEVLGFDALMDSMWLCKRGVSWKPSVSHYLHHQITETLRLEEQLRTHTYRPRPVKTFVITHPKRRVIRSTSFRDRVYQRCLNDHILYPAMARTFIKENCACQKGKGTDFARNLLKEHLHRFYRKHGTAGYVLQIDIKGYYEHMRHDVVKEQFRQHVPAWASERINAVLDGQYAGETGFNPGSQMVQIAGISYLSPLDHYIKERLRVKLYLRYMDDLILVHEDPRFLGYCLRKIAEQLGAVGLWPHPKKTKIYPISKGIDFLGFHYSLSPTGKVYLKLLKGNIKHERRKLARMVRLVKAGRMTTEKLNQCYQSWEAHADHGNSYHIKLRMRAYLERLVKDYGI